MRFGILGDPAGHSLSPAIHRAGYAKHGLDWSHDAITVAPQDLAEFIQQVIDGPEWAGIGVTAPHKEHMLGFGEADHVAKLVGGANTLVKHEDKITLHNTDVPGFVRAWKERGGGNVNRAAIAGNGATARSVLIGLAGLEVQEVIILARRPERAAPLVELGSALGVNVEALPMDAEFGEVDLFGSTVPVEATAPHAERWAAAAGALFDAVYDPWPTPVASAATPDHIVVTGLDLLAGQAVDQFFLATGKEMTFSECLEAAEAELRRRGA